MPSAQPTTGSSSVIIRPFTKTSAWAMIARADSRKFSGFEIFISLSRTFFWVWFIFDDCPSLAYLVVDSILLSCWCVCVCVCVCVCGVIQSNYLKELSTVIAKYCEDDLNK